MYSKPSNKFKLPVSMRAVQYTCYLEKAILNICRFDYLEFSVLWGLFKHHSLGEIGMSCCGQFGILSSLGWIQLR